MSLSNILEQIKVNSVYADAELDNNNPATFGSRLGVERAAQEKIKRLKLEYRNELMTSAMFIVVTGPGCDRFTEIATNTDFNCLSADPDAFFKELASNIDPRLYGRENTRNLFNVADKVLYDKMIDLDIQSYPTLRFSEKFNVGVKNAEEFVPLIRSAVSEQIGGEIVGINAVHSVVDQAIVKNHAATITPIILNTSDDKFALDLQSSLKRKLLPDGTYTGLTDKVFLVVTGKNKTQIPDSMAVKNVNEESVGEALSSIRNKVL